MKRTPHDTYTTRTGQLATAAFYYARGLRFKDLETQSPEGKHGAFYVNFVFSGGEEVEHLSDTFHATDPEVTLPQIRAFVDVLQRRLSKSALREAAGGTP